MNYKEMSDSAINEQITNATHDLDGWEFCENSKVFYHCGVDGSEYFEQPIINYCNSWDDMGPLIESIWCKLTETYCYDWPDDNAYDTWWDHVMDEYSCSRLRAAAICWLMIKDSQPGN